MPNLLSDAPCNRRHATRREFVVASGAVLAAGMLAGSAPLAFAQDPSVESLMRPGPLPDLVLGGIAAPVTIIEYASMTSPHCASFHKTTYPALKTRYIDAGKVRFIFREFPLDELAVAAAMLVRCAGDKAMAMIDLLFASQDKWAVREPLPQLLLIARQAGLTETAFNACMSDRKLYDNVTAMRDRGSKELKVESTPTLFVNGLRRTGVATVEEMDKLIEPLLKG
jgi:protein-disulfide isomerase